MLKSIYKWLILLIILSSCSNESKDKKIDHSVNDSSARVNELADTLVIDKYVKEIKSKTPELTYKRSLQYILGDYTFDVSVYFKDGKQVVYVEDGHRSEQDYRRLNVFLKDEKPIYAELAEKITMGSNNEFREAKVYFNQKLEILKALERKTSKENKIQDIPFVPFKPDTTGYSAKTNFFRRAVDCTGEFDLPFEKIEKKDNKEYLILGKDDPNTYHVKLLIEKSDSTIKKLKSSPIAFKGKKIDLEWEYKNSKGYEQLVYKSGKIL
ncbi:hypothetical protein NF867_02090 [Solitalea sp. MAHUQ-68]|uniref:Lipoprotein n=1 Tax=Solitalea agri TaxID=2953739 RepID=A0A9X2JCC9_9SPHI|nr:hypothetical protein [Solitalea agri]MCO4291655.1 hypothetical protein [Solitalea agri]